VEIACAAALPALAKYLTGAEHRAHRIQSVVLAAKECKDVEPSQKALSGMIHELIEDKIIA